MTSLPFPDSINSLVRSASVAQHSDEQSHVVFLRPQDVAVSYI